MICSKNILSIITIALATMGLLSCQKDQVITPAKTVGAPPSVQLSAMIAGSSRMTIFAAALQRTHLNDTLLSGKAPYTVYAPTDDAFAAAGISLQAVNSMNLDSLRALVRYHIAAGYYPSYSTAAYSSFKLLNIDSSVLYVAKGLHYTTNLFLTNDFPGNYYVDGILADSIDLDCTNGLLYMIEGVLTPPTKADVLTYLAGNPQYTLFTYALQVTGMGQTLLGTTVLKNIYFPTVFAPTDQAMMNTGFLRSKAAIDSMYANDQANGTQNLINIISTPMVSIGGTNYYYQVPPPTEPYYMNDLINTTYKTPWGFGEVASSYRNPLYLEPVDILVTVDARLNVSFSFGVFDNGRNDWIYIGTNYAHVGTAIRVSNAVVYPTDAVILP